MPLTNIGSYVTVMDEFVAHWTDTNAILGGTPATDLKLEGGVTLAMFITSRNDLEAKLIAEQGLENARQIATANRDALKLALRDRLGQFRGLVRGLLSKTKYASAVPTLPELTQSESKFLAAFDDAADLWGRIDADATIPGFTPPLKILLYGRTEFVADLAAVRVVFLSVMTAKNDLEINQSERDAMLPIARERMVQYRVLVPALLGPNHPQSQSLPVLYPAPGSTPDPVPLTGAWNPVTNRRNSVGPLRPTRTSRSTKCGGPSARASIRRRRPSSETFRPAPRPSKRPPVSRSVAIWSRSSCSFASRPGTKRAATR